MAKPKEYQMANRTQVVQSKRVMSCRLMNIDKARRNGTSGILLFLENVFCCDDKYRKINTTSMLTTNAAIGIRRGSSR